MPPGLDPAVRARNVRLVAISSMLIVTGLEALLCALVPSSWPRWLAIAATTDGACAAALILVLRGRVRGAAVALIAAQLAMLAAAAWSNGGVRSPAYAELMVVVMIAALLVGARGAAAVAALVIALGGVLAGLAAADRLPAPSVQHTDWSVWTLASAFTVLAVVLLHRIVGELTTALGRAAAELAERARAEAQLRAVTERFELAADAAALGVWDWDVAADLVTWNVRQSRIYGVAPSEEPYPAARWAEAIHPDDRPHVEAQLAAARQLATDAAGVVRASVRFRAVRPDGSIRYVRAAVSVLPGPDGGVARIVGLAADVTDEVAAERERRRLVRALGDRIKELRALHAAAQLLAGDRAVDVALLAELAALLPAAFRAPAVCQVRLTVGDVVAATPGWRADAADGADAGDGPGPGLSVGFVCADGRAGAVEVAYSAPRAVGDGGPFLAEERELVQSVAELLRGHVERTLAQAALGAHEAQLRAVFDGAAVGMALLGLDGRLRRVNPALTRLLGYDEAAMTAMRLGDLTHPDDRAADEALRAQLFAGARDAYRLEKRYLHQDGSIVWGAVTMSLVRAGGEPSYVVGMVEDITAQRRAEDERAALEGQLRQAQKMEAVGRLAGGIAHDFNNLLTVIETNTELLLRELPPAQAAAVDDVREATARASALTRQLLAFSRKTVLQPEVVDAAAEVRRAERMLTRLIGEDITIVIDAADAGRVRADRTHLEQVLMNLAVNARDAMPTGGTLTLGVRALALAAAGPAHPGVPAGAWVMIEVRDTGCGMDAATQARVFEPFFTTKPVGAGSGLGLSVVHGIVAQSGGHLTVDSAPGKGATFRIYLPRTDDAPGQLGAPAPAPVALPRGGETVLLVEDEPALRRLVRKVLRDQGYRVLDAPDGRAALELARRADAPIELLLCDVVLPSMGGRRTAELVGEVCPAIKVLFVSGYLDDALMRHGIDGGGVNFLAKPFTPATLAQKVRQVLDAA